MITTEIIPVENNEVIDLVIAKNHLRIEEDFDEDDDLISLQIKAAHSSAKNYMQRAVGLQDLVIITDIFQAIVYEGSSNDKITKIEYYDNVSGVLETLDVTLYELRKTGLETYTVSFKSVLPVLEERSDAIKITISQGYSVVECPSDIKAAMLLMLGDMYERREDREQGNNPASINLLRPYRKW